MKAMQVFGMVVVLLSGGTLIALPAAAATATAKHEQTFTAVASGEVKVDAAFHQIKVTVHAQATILVSVNTDVSGPEEAIRPCLDLLVPAIQAWNDDVLVRILPPGGFAPPACAGVEITGTVSLSLPAGQDVSIDTVSGDVDVKGDLGTGELTCELVSGDLAVEGAMRELDAETVSGGIDVQLSRKANDLKLKSVSGGISLKGSARDISLESQSGDIVAEKLAGEARLKTASGRISASWDSLGLWWDISATSVSGEIQLLLPKDAKLGGDAEIGSGKLVSDFPTTPSTKKYDEYFFPGGFGAVELDLETKSGTIRVLAAKRE